MAAASSTAANIRAHAAKLPIAAICDSRAESPDDTHVRCTCQHLNEVYVQSYTSQKHSHKDADSTVQPSQTSWVRAKHSSEEVEQISIVFPVIHITTFASTCHHPALGLATLCGRCCTSAHYTQHLRQESGWVELADSGARFITAASGHHKPSNYRLPGHDAQAEAKPKLHGSWSLLKT